ncbi:o-succinylbenzoate synthase [Secundilactobacillus collinoides]|uniref:o-succinylbenzoate synthase n=1 Tax=Secundilactobacillus collinoides DSM 20515 = JCM 1123 TaxID=1423733 RepID=A0A0R2BE20_SECCO|nr:o-succinylbenzoate synthase [Secundilactobacillus collinoides]KRM77441.1 N-acylamino acid racemase [Secundilactobacillus collinoides DSM 20515 = JCM 1123]
MKIVEATLRKVDIPLRDPFETSFLRMYAKKTTILELKDEDGTFGYGEFSAFNLPFYNEEFRDGGFDLLSELILPKIVGREIKHPDDMYDLIKSIRRNNMAKSAVNCALWDIYSKQQNEPLAKALGGTKSKVEVGVSIGVQKSPEQLVEVVRGYLNDGYKRIKCKIKPGKDYDYLAAVRAEFPTVQLMGDANSAYRPDDFELLKRLDPLNLIMIEQPLEPGDLLYHAKLQKQIKTPICLDESVTSLEDTDKMIELGSGKIINIKVSRVGGLSIAKKIQQRAMENGIKCWCGGMIDSGVARAENIAIATLPGYVLANDIAPSIRYYDRDIITPMVQMNRAFVDVPEEAGIGFDIDWTNMNEFTLETKKITADTEVTV